jgi:hypothetical protein
MSSSYSVHYPVYRIYVFSEGSNSYSTARAERWEVKPDCSFESLESARDYIRAESRKHTELPRFLLQLRESLKLSSEGDTEQIIEQFIDQFCFESELYAKYRRFFIGKPPLGMIKRSLNSVGVAVAVAS